MGWISKMQKWTVFDSDKKDFTLVQAESQRQAWVRAANDGIIAKRSSHVRPRTGDATLMSRSEFEDFLEKKL